MFFKSQKNSREQFNIPSTTSLRHTRCLVPAASDWHVRYRAGSDTVATCSVAPHNAEVALKPFQNGGLFFWHLRQVGKSAEMKGRVRWTLGGGGRRRTGSYYCCHQLVGHVSSAPQTAASSTSRTLPQNRLKLFIGWLTRLPEQRQIRV